jgi:hypothetical protein
VTPEKVKITLLRVIPTIMRGSWHQLPQIAGVVVVED